MSVDAHDGAGESNLLELLLLPPKLLSPKPLPLELPILTLPDGESVHDELEEDAMAGRETQKTRENLARGMHVSAIMCVQECVCNAVSAMISWATQPAGSGQPGSK